MRILFDENLSFSLAGSLVGYECSHVIRQGWSGTKNGALLGLAEQTGYDVLLTLDDDLRFEQNLTGRRISVVILRPKRQGKQAVEALAGLILRCLGDIGPGEIRVVGEVD